MSDRKFAAPLRWLAAAVMLSWAAVAGPTAAAEDEFQITPFMQAVAEAAARDRDIADFYKRNGYRAVWTGQEPIHLERRAALLASLGTASDHALPVSAYDPDLLAANLRRIRSERDLGIIEVELSRIFLRFARDLQTGVLNPRQIDPGIVREVPRRDRAELLREFAAASPGRFFRDLPPKTPEYARLMRAKLELEAEFSRGGWGPKVEVSALKPGERAPDVVALRNRLMRMGYLGRSMTATYDADIEKAVRRFQSDHGLEPDGVAGPGTMTEINKQIEDRLPSVVVAMERERWMNFPRGERHVWVNLTDFSAAIIDNDEVTFRTRSVIGKDELDRRSPEFSDVMEHMVINPSWHVPRSIAVKEYLPRMLRNPGAVRHLQLVNSQGRVVSRAAVNWQAYTPQSFPFDLKQPPSRQNALGLVKFMFPNPYNIYLHDTPAKNLFLQQRRDFSHGCIRLNDPFDFAYELLSRQTNDPEGYFQSILRTGRETRVNLETPIPVHLIYRTAFTTARGELHFRNDVYGRDARIFRALINAGVVLADNRS